MMSSIRRITTFLRTSRKSFAVAFLVVAVMTIFLRTWHVGEWLHYELDQARDYRIIHAAIVHGPGELPLQGPKAAGNVTIIDAATGERTDKTTLRLGPFFYYLEYVSARLFGDTPLGSIVLIIALSIVTVGVFYVFAHWLFSRWLALGVAGIVASSLFFVTYSRFGWNPNLLPLFMVTFVVMLIVAAHGTTQRRRGWALVAAAGALAAVGQLHFLAFTTAPVIGAAFILWTWRRFIGRNGIAPRYWALAFALFLLMQVPLVINDIKTGGENAKAFAAALTQKSSKSARTLPEKVVRNVRNHAKYAWLIATGDQRADLPTVRGRDVRCDGGCRAGLVRGGMAATFLAAALIIWVDAYRRARGRTRSVLRIVILWSGVTFAAYTPLAYDMAPRFFLVHGLTVPIFLGLVVQRIARRSAGVATAVIVAAIGSNLWFVAEDFAQRAAAARGEDVRIPTDYVLKEKTRMPFILMEQIVTHIAQRAAAEELPVWVHGQAEFKRAFWERLDARGVPRFGAPTHLDTAYRDGLYFIIVRTQADHDAFLRKTLRNATIREKKSFGTLTLYELVPRDEVLRDDVPQVYVPRRDPRFSPNAQVRYLWRQVLQ